MGYVEISGLVKKTMTVTFSNLDSTINLPFSGVIHTRSKMVYDTILRDYVYVEPPDPKPPTSAKISVGDFSIISTSITITETGEIKIISHINYVTKTMSCSGYATFQLSDFKTIMQKAETTPKISIVRKINSEGVAITTYQTDLSGRYSWWYIPPPVLSFTVGEIQGGTYYLVLVYYAGELPPQEPEAPTVPPEEPTVPSDNRTLMTIGIIILGIIVIVYAIFKRR